MKKEKRQMWYREKMRILTRDPYISVEAKLLLALLDSFASLEGIDCWPTVKTLMRHTGRCKRWVERYLRELQDMNRIEIIGKHEGRFGWSNKYRIHYINWGVEKSKCSVSQNVLRGRAVTCPTDQVSSTGVVGSDVQPDNVVPFTDRTGEDSPEYGKASL